MVGTDPKNLIGFLWRTGHFWNPENPDGWDVKETDLPALTMTDRVVKDAVRSFQNADGNFDFLSSIHGAGKEDQGEVGPLTVAVYNLPRCPVPDHPAPPGVRVKTGDSDFDGLARSMQEWVSAGSGSWPGSGCDPERRGVHSIRVGIDWSRAPAGVKAYKSQALEAARNAFAEMGLAVRYVDGEGGEIAKRFENLAGSTIGWNYFPSPGSCRQITGRLDTGYSPSDYRLWACLETHETGHGVGLEHTRGSIMNPSILLVWPLTWKGTPSESAMRRFFGGSPVSPPTVPPPPTSPPVSPPGAPWPDPPPVGPPAPVPDLGKVVVDLAARTVSVPKGWTVKQG